MVPTCAGCLKPDQKLFPFRPRDSYRGPRWAFPKYCERCIKAERARQKRLAELLTAQRWAEKQTAEMLWRAYDADTSKGPYRGMIRTEPWPEQKRVPDFIWDLKPTHTVVTEYSRGLRYLKTHW